MYLREEICWRVSEEVALRICTLKVHEVTGACGKHHNEERHDCTFHLILLGLLDQQVWKTRTSSKRCKTRNTYKTSFRKPQGTKHLGDICVDGRIILNGS